MIKLSQLLKESSEEKIPLSNEVKKHFLEIVSTYNKYQEMMDRKSDLATVAETLGGITEAARTLAIHEGDDWFDKQTIKRNMSELEKLGKEFDKCAIEATSLDQRLGGLYEDMGNILSRYYKMGDITEEQMKERLGMNESKSDCGCGCGGVTEGGCSTNVVEESVVNEAFATAKKIYSDAKGKLFFGYKKDDNSVHLVDYNTWKKLGMKDLSNEFLANRLINAIVKSQKQLNKKVDYNMWSKKTNPSFEQRMDWFIKNGWINNINKGGIKESVNEAKKFGDWSVTREDENQIKLVNQNTMDDLYVHKSNGKFEVSYKKRRIVQPSLKQVMISVLKLGESVVNESIKDSVVKNEGYYFQIRTAHKKKAKEYLDKKYKKLYKWVSNDVFFFPTTDDNEDKIYRMIQWLDEDLNDIGVDVIDQVMGGESVNEENPGLWANIRAKKARGEKPANKNSQAHKDAVKAGEKINKEESVVKEANFGYKDSTASYINNHNDEYKQAEKLNKGNEVKFYDTLSQMEDKIGHPKFMIFLSNALRGYKVDMYKDSKIKNPQDAQEALYLLSK